MNSNASMVIDVAPERTQATQSANPDRRYQLSEELIVLSQTATPAVEAMRALAVQLISQQVSGGRRGLAICGASAGVGVTFSAANLAVAMSQMGVSTLLIDANMHDPGIQRLITPLEDGLGLSELLRSDEVRLSDAIRGGVLPGLSVIYAGEAVAEASDLVEEERFRRLLEGCLRDHDFTIIDTPPANRWADCRAISKLVGYAMIVARRNLSFVDDIGTLAGELTDARVSLVGVVLNGA
jgi:protein-tyrosine kinase